MDALQQLNIAAPVADVFGKIEYDIIMAIARQLSRNPEQLINHTSEWRIQMLARMGKIDRDTARYIAQQTAGVPGEIESIINETITAVLAENGLAGNTDVIENIEKALTAFDHQAVKDKYNQVNTVMQYKAKKAYVNGVNSVADKFGKNEIANKQEHLDILNKNALEVTLGEKSRTEAIRDTIREMSDKGIPAFVDASGREWSPEAYVNMDIRNTAKNAALMSEFECTKELGQDVILVSSHAAARPLCAPYQGKFYSLSGKAGTITDAYGKEYTYTPLSSTSYGEPAGLLGINCGHTFRGVEDGMFVNNEEQYDEKENSEEYDKVVKQRAMEREIRKNKMKRDALKAAGDDEGAKEYDLRVKRDTKRMTEYCEQNNLAVRMDRTQVYGYTDPNLKQKPKEFVEIVEPKKPAFVPAGSIEEAQTKAEAHFKEYFGDKTFKGKADFKGISLDNANDICERLDKLYSEYDIPPLAGIKAIDPNSAKGKKIFADADAVMAYSPIEHGVFLNKNVLKNSDTLAKYNRESDEAWNTVMNNIDTLSGSKKAMALRYKQAGRALVGDGSVGDYLQHEVGHHVQWEVLDAKTNNLIGSRMSDYATKISGYATASKGEYIAESFSAYVKGQRNILDSEFVSFMDQKRLDNFGKSGIIKSLDIDDYNIMIKGRGVQKEVSDLIIKTINDYEKKGGFYISDVHCGCFFDERTGKTALFQIVQTPFGLTDININTDVLSGMTLEQVNNIIAATDSNLPENLVEAIIHECGHAKAYKGKRPYEIEKMNNELADKGVPGISDIAEADGAECIAETEVLLFRKAKVPQAALDLYDKYIEGRVK